MSPAQLQSDDDRHEVLWRTYLAVQREQQALGTLPAIDRTLLSRLGGLLAWIGAVQLGILVSCIGTLGVFVVTRMFMHLDFSRFFPG